MEKMIVPMSAPDISQAEIDAVQGVLRTSSISMGPQIDALEQEMERIAGTQYAIGVSSGTAGLHLSVILAGIGAGDLVITTPFSFIASANCILYEQAVPVFVDVDAETGAIQPSLVEEAVENICHGGRDSIRFLPPALQSKKRSLKPVKAILPVNVFIQAADFDRIMEIAQRNKIKVIEDACETVAAGYKERPAGSLGDIGVLAFYPNKQMTTGEGGMITTNRKDWAERARSLRNQGRSAGSTWLDHEQLGYNYRLDEMSAALGLAQARRLPQLLAKRNQVAVWYQERLSGLTQIRLPVVASYTSTVSWFVYVVRIQPSMERSEVIGRLAVKGIPSRKYFSPIHLQPFYAKRFGYRRGDFPVCERLGEESLALPFSSVMTEEQVDVVCQALRQAVSR